jgi:hypothetical protein
VKLQYLCHPRFFIISMGVAMTCAAAEPAHDTTPVNNFPTQARVEYVTQCINSNGGKLAALYQCSCAIDRIANSLTYDDYVEVTTVIKNANLPGEGGGMFRDSERGRKLVKNYRELESDALRSCGINPRLGA